ncbi:MAG: UDP-glucose 4-epimerase, partial [Chloroflexi bacterium]|nr:UDP-glucose 4-epimerase [Chloroflexota bacterium]
NHLARELTMLTEWRGQPEYLPPREGDIHKVSLNAERAGRELGWAPSVDFADGLIKTVDFFRDQS